MTGVKAHKRAYRWAGQDRATSGIIDWIPGLLTPPRRHHASGTQAPRRVLSGLGRAIELTLVGELRQLLRHPLPRAVLPADEQDLRNRREMRSAEIDCGIDKTDCTASLTLSPLGKSGLDANSISARPPASPTAEQSLYSVLTVRRDRREPRRRAKQAIWGERVWGLASGI